MEKRGKWNNWCEFLFSCLGYMFGLGNVWRFPYICFKNGGGVGYGMTALTSLIALYYNVIIALALYYAAMSFSSTLPWSTCDNHWNTPLCVTLELTNVGNGSALDNYNISKASVEINTTRPATEEFWEFEVLKVTSGIENLGTLQWPITLCHCATWALASIVLVKGINSSGNPKRTISATLPYLLMLTLFIRSLTLDGSTDGMKYFIIPKWEELANFTVWVDGAMQAFYSIGIGSGVILTLSSYKDFNTDVCRDAILLPILDSLSSLFAGCVVFATLGYMSVLTQKDIADVVSQGPGISFMVYPEALSTLPLPQLWSVIFFLMLFMVGMNAQILVIQAISTNLMDIFPKLRKRLTLVNTLCCLAGLVFGLIFTTQGGIYILQLLDFYTFAFSGFLLSFLEVTAIAWLYGVDRLQSDIEQMVGYKPSRLWRYFWKVVCPPIILTLWLFTIITIKPLKYGNLEYPQWAIGIGWLGSACSLIFLPICFFNTVRKEEGSLLEGHAKSKMATMASDFTSAT